MMKVTFMQCQVHLLPAHSCSLASHYVVPMASYGQSRNLAQKHSVKLNKCSLHSKGVWPLRIIRFTGQNFSWCRADTSTMTRFISTSMFGLSQTYWPNVKAVKCQVHFDHSSGTVTHTQYQHRHLWVSACHTPVTWGGQRPSLSQV